MVSWLGSYSPSSPTYKTNKFKLKQNKDNNIYFRLTFGLENSINTLLRLKIVLFGDKY
jgi:hypothetical protein